MMIVKHLAENPDDIYAPRYAVIGESGIVIRTFENRSNAWEFAEWLNRSALTIWQS